MMTHSCITDTSAIMYVFPDGVRNDRRMPGGGGPDAGVTGDPTLATPEIGQMVVRFKVVGALQQYRELTAPPRAGRGRRGGGPSRGAGGGRPRILYGPYMVFII